MDGKITAISKYMAIRFKIKLGKTLTKCYKLAQRYCSETDLEPLQEETTEIGFAKMLLSILDNTLVEKMDKHFTTVYTDAEGIPLPEFENCVEYVNKTNSDISIYMVNYCIELVENYIKTLPEPV